MHVETKTPPPQSIADYRNEVEHLKNTIYVMREQLEQAELQRLRAGEAAAAEMNILAAQLQSIIVALREELERQNAQHEDAIEALKRAAREDVTQLQDVITALRQKLEEKL
jgi:predicted  nucleic acid-binding Zn-ribbon protein